MKTIKQHLETLKEPYKTRAINNTSNNNLKLKRISTSLAIYDAFTWSNTPEGSDYWRSLFFILEESIDNEK